jgi:tRNA dimethylallyltransferase
VTTHLAIVGSTATGKTDLALAVARRLGDVEIVSLDAMQVYRGMDIGTAKSTPAELAEIPHHLVDVAEPMEEWSVQRTQQGARAAIADIAARGKRALLVGGTGLYVHAVVDDLQIPGGDDDTRAALLAATETPEGLSAAYARLVARDPAAAARIEPGNRRRIVRALEVLDVTGRPFSSFGPGVSAFGLPVIPLLLVGIWRTRADLAVRINRRVASMRSAGLDAEVAALERRGLSRTAAQAIGYKELLGGPTDLEAAYDEIVRRTRKFARRQRVWFRRDPRITWIAADHDQNADAMVDALLALWFADRQPVTP